MLSNLISNLFWNSYERRCDAQQEEARKTQEILDRTAYLATEPTSIFYVKPF